MNIPENLQTVLLPILLRILAAIVVLLIGRWLARAVRRWVTQALTRTQWPESMETLILRLAYAAVWLAAILIALTLLGVPTAALISAIGIIVIVLGIALQESLRDIAATVSFLLFQPFRVGEVIESNGVLGEVKEIQLFSTIVHQADNKVAILPNGQIKDSKMLNYSRLGILRADLFVTISYQDDLLRAQQLLQEMLAADPRVLSHPAIRKSLSTDWAMMA